MSKLEDIVSLMSAEERAVFSLRALYNRHGYTRYRVNHFEEYDLYVRNKDFLVSDSVITFTDTNGKLLALKPDVTLSIVRNTRDEATVTKMHYNESVFRVAHRSGSFEEIMQAGLECIGNIGLYETCEVLLLAAKSLEVIGSGRFMLDISHMGLLNALFSACEASGEVKARLMDNLNRKHHGEIARLCNEEGLSAAWRDRLLLLVETYGGYPVALQRMKETFTDDAYAEALNEMEAVCRALDEAGYRDSVSVDFSVVNNAKYYSGIVFRGYLEGIPTGVLSGGRYDPLMRRMGRKSGGIGFAVSLDMLEERAAQPVDADILLLYDEKDDPARVFQTAERLSREGSVFAAKAQPSGRTYGRTAYMEREAAT